MSVKRFAEMIKECENIVFFGGAGVSTESGVKDYRSKDGLYSTVKDYGVSPEVILSHSFFFQNPDIFYDFYRKYFTADVLPNKAHKALAKLEKIGKYLSDKEFKNIILFLGEKIENVVGEAFFAGLDGYGIQTLSTETVTDVDLEKIAHTAFSLPSAVDAIVGVGGVMKWYSPKEFAIAMVIYVIIYTIIWLINFLYWKHTVSKMNEQLEILLKLQENNKGRA